jgi:hypothetical protein
MGRCRSHADRYGMMTSNEHVYGTSGDAVAMLGPRFALVARYGRQSSYAVYRSSRRERL